MREESQNKIDADFRDREQAFKEKKHKDLCDLKERELIILKRISKRSKNKGIKTCIKVWKK